MLTVMYSHTDDKHKSKGEAEPIIPTLPEVKEHAAKAIARAAKNGKQDWELKLTLSITHPTASFSGFVGKIWDICPSINYFLYMHIFGS